MGKNATREFGRVGAAVSVCGVQIVTRAWMTTQWMLLQCVDDHTMEVITVCE